MLFLSFLWIFNRCCKRSLLSLTSKAYILFPSILIVESENRAVRVILAQKRKSETSHYMLVYDLRVSSDTFKLVHLILFFKTHSARVSSFIFESAWIIYPIISYTTRVGSSSMESARVVCLLNYTLIESSRFNVLSETFFACHGRVDSSILRVGSSNCFY